MDGMQLEIHREYDYRYAITKNGADGIKVVVSEFIDPETYFQVGDCSSYYYRYENCLIVQHCGDVSSIVIVNFDP
jgi:hypothetical protein